MTDLVATVVGSVSTPARPAEVREDGAGVRVRQLAHLTVPRSSA